MVLYLFCHFFLCAILEAIQFYYFSHFFAMVDFLLLYVL